jgi:hypothetical protein
MARRRDQVTELYLQGFVQTAIAEKLGISQSTVCFDLKAVHKGWRESAIRDFDAARDLELKKLERIEREAWAAWERSQKPIQSATVNGDGAGPPNRKAMRSQHGDARFLAIILKCSEERRAMLGLDAPLKIAPVTPDGQEPYRLAVADLSVGELRTLKHLNDRMLAVNPEQVRMLTVTSEPDHDSDDPPAGQQTALD